MTKRKKKVVMTGITLEVAEEAFAKYAKATAQVKKINAQIELQTAKLREKYQAELAQLREEIEASFDVLNTGALENKAEWFKNKKSLDLAHGTIGFRTGTPKLKTLKGFTWASALELAKQFMPNEYMRTTVEIAKDKLLDDRELSDKLLSGTSVNGSKECTLAEVMARCGLMYAQDESFFVTVKEEEDVNK